MTPFQRDASIKKFSNDPTVTVFLISLKAGGVALNLTAASRVFICDPWWNPAAGWPPPPFDYVELSGCIHVHGVDKQY